MSPKVHCASKDRMNLLQIALLLFNQEFKKFNYLYYVLQTRLLLSSIFIKTVCQNPTNVK